jgi:cytochrome c peroxidase
MHGVLLATILVLGACGEPGSEVDPGAADTAGERDERISLDAQTACASCHTVEAWGGDARRLSPDARGELTSRQSQTVFNATLQPSLRWLGDRESATEQAHGSITGSMGFDDDRDVIPVLEEYGYGDRFRGAFPDDPEPLSPENYGRALEAYQATLVTPAPFDDFLAGDPEALSEDQKAGLDLFISTGCAGCHSGELLGGAGFQPFGVAEDYWTATNSAEIDEGRFAITGEEGDRYVFRTPMLRNVARTGPYFHDGSVESLEEAIRIMARIQLRQDLDDDEVRLIAAFPESLTG